MGTVPLRWTSPVNIKLPFQYAVQVWWVWNIVQAVTYRTLIYTTKSVAKCIVPPMCCIHTVQLMWDHIDCDVDSTVMWGGNDPWWHWLKMPFSCNLQSHVHCWHFACGKNQFMLLVFLLWASQSDRPAGTARDNKSLLAPSVSVYSIGWSQPIKYLLCSQCDVKAVKHKEEPRGGCRLAFAYPPVNW